MTKIESSVSVLALVTVSAAKQVSAQSAVYQGTVSNYGVAAHPAEGLSGLLALRFRSTATLTGRATIGAPLGGSGPYQGRIWRDTLILRSVSDAGDTIFWLARINGDTLQGPYIVLGGQSQGQGGVWQVARVSGPRVVPRRQSARPFPDSVSLEEALAPFSRLPRTARGARPPPESPLPLGPLVARSPPAEERVPMQPWAHGSGGAGARWVGWAALGLIAVFALWVASFGRDLGQIRRDRRVLLALIFVPGLYATLAVSLGLVIAIAGAVIYCVYLLASLVNIMPVGVMLLVGLGALYGIGVLLNGMIESVQRASMSTLALPLVGEDAPGLFHRLELLCRQMDCTVPQSVVLELGPSFFVTEAKVRTPTGVSKGRTLCISAPLLRLLSVEEFVAIVAHEMAHFTGADTAFSRRFYPVYRGTAVAIRGLNDITSNAARNQNAAYMGCSLVIPLMLLHWYLGAFARLERTIGRQRELRADTLAAQHTSRGATASALVKVHAYAPAWAGTTELVHEAAIQNKAYRNLSELFAGWAARATDLIPTALHGSQMMPPHPTDTHPSLKDRLENLGYVDGSTPIPLEGESAASLIPGLERLELKLTELFTWVIVEQGRSNLPPAHATSSVPPSPPAA
jgi:Zn-dependent protease with chaperone function